jgi:PAS domain-containing protein
VTESVDQVLRDSGLIERGVEDVFDCLARLTAGATRAPICIVVFGPARDACVKGYAGPASENPDALVPLALHDVLMEGRREAVAHQDAAGCAIATEGGLVVGGLWVRTHSPRTWTEDALDMLKASARLLQAELSVRKRRRPDEVAARILESISDACVFLDAQWRYTYVNRKAGEIFSREPRSLVGKHIWTEFPEGVGQPFYHAYQRAMPSSRNITHRTIAGSKTASIRRQTGWPSSFRT